MDGTGQQAEQFARKRLRHLLIQAPTANLTAMLVASLYAVMLGFETGQPYRALAWMLLTWLAALARWRLWRRHRAYPQRLKTAQWFNRYATLSAVLGACWSLVYLLVLPGVGLTLVGAMAMLFFGVMVSAYSILSVSPTTFICYTLPSTLTFLWMLSHLEGQMYPVMATGVSMFYLMLMVFAFNAGRSLDRLLGLEVSNESLIAQLRDEVSQRDQRVAAQTRTLSEVNQALSQSERQLKNVLSGANLGFWDWHYPTGLHEVNDRWLEILGLDRSAIRNHVADWEERVHPEDLPRVNKVLGRHVRNGSPYVAEFRMRHAQGHWVWIQGAGAVVEYGDDGQPLRLSGTYQEIDQRKRLELDLAYQASHDALTGLLNRNQLWARLGAEIDHAQRHQQQVTLCLLDIDHFKRINDQHGHPFGDQVLQYFVNLMRRETRDKDLALRYGGEEFILVLPDAGLEQGLETAERLRSRVEQEVIDLDGQTLQVTVSIGVACFPEHARDGNVLVAVADLALYQAKRGGRNRVEIAQASPAPD